MAFGKEEKQKAFLSLLLLAFLLYAYFEFLLGPLQRKSNTYRTGLDTVEADITAARKQIARIKAMEDSAPEHALTLKRIVAQIPDGAPIAWVPPRISNVFKNVGIDRVPVKSNGDSELKDVPGFKVTRWGVEVENMDLAQIGKAIAQLENEEILSEVQSIQIDNNGKLPGDQHLNITITTLVKK